MLDETSIGTLRSAFSGPLLLPSDDGYDAGRRIFNGLIDKRPALIARARSAADAAAAVGFARDVGLEISVRGGGHGVAGRAVCDDGLMIDLSLMRRVNIDPERRTATAQGGVTWGEFNDAAAVHGLATTGGVVSTTGIAGLTLGGGFGYLMGTCGMASDNLVGAEVVTADGQILSANADEHPDLFWALRGAGANFGVVTSFEYGLHPVTEIVRGRIAHPFRAAGELLRLFRDFTAGAPDEVYAYGGLAYAPDGSGEPVAVLTITHSGDEASAEADLRPLVEFGSPLIADVETMSYPVINAMFDEAYPMGSLNYWKSSFLSELDDDAIDTMIETFRASPADTSEIGLEHYHGAATRVGVTETAVPHREPGHNLLVTSSWADPAESDRNIAWSREAYAALEPFFAGRRYVNYLSEDDEDATGREVYGPNSDRLATIKATYDPDNAFHLNQNIRPLVT